MSGSSSSGALPLRWAVILLLAALVGVVVAGLTVLQTGSWPAALLAALTGTGAAITTGHQILAGR
ncbi:hypothetical protein [Virgisporangium aurantiacum]|uniref:hypothetical protein n=1 Tax=Virgisporangium aurantiacum TaxID=175570 RepID=UPI00195126A7|nr:hypothetical protein [Virgisporangium aurantiacum]